MLCEVSGLGSLVHVKFYDNNLLPGTWLVNLRHEEGYGHETSPVYG